MMQVQDRLGGESVKKITFPRFYAILAAIGRYKLINKDGKTDVDVHLLASIEKDRNSKPSIW